MTKDVYCAFALYKAGELIGYRQDTFGTIGKDGAKIYPYTESQCEICLKNTQDQIMKRGDGIGKALKNAGFMGDVLEIIEAQEKEMYQKLEDARAFEVRVVKAPAPEYEFDVKKAEYVRTWTWDPFAIKQWLENPDEHEVLEMHHYSIAGKLILQ